MLEQELAEIAENSRPVSAETEFSAPSAVSCSTPVSGVAAFPEQEQEFVGTGVSRVSRE